ncbi:uncharacterized protein N7496_005373 [Penicillium cataractarum]|uniref:Uncharacterized protein n=1 Tax=Penicillium cataractarum TaxID=2100454 RepID=A0A9W9VEL5_9EURO|nr:uncharacterized protein N7496_005373 [Penicillium cataractarum]KAJ5377964.1 hypothetical protein N7496_005373 [Penicillium cataractarum]
MDGVLGIPELRRQCSWWKRHSLYSVVGVKEVMFRFAKFDKRTKEVSVYVKDFDYKSRIAEIESAVNHLPSIEDPWECGVDIMGKGHTPVDICPNTAYDSIDGEPYCVAQELRKRTLQREMLEWLPAMIEFYWQNGIESDQVEFLENGNFVRQYEDLAWDRGTDALSPYGRVIYGFQLIEGWHIRSIFCLFIGSLFLSACVVAISTAILHSFEAGLTAGSYALAIAAVTLAGLTFFSAII